ncbi:MAG: hypothetical protein HY598_01615, partial [Candidatus Omnitrophica bacterium]|nr:hypothetical protein [Candidatus Omnitrophota bacterium]
WQHTAHSTQHTASTVGRLVLGLVALTMWVCPAARAAIEREPVTMSVVAINPSEKETKVTNVRIELPKEVTPKDVLELGELELEYNEDRATYFVQKEAIALAPKETRVFEVQVRDLWFVDPAQLDSLKDYTKLLLGKLEKSDYYKTAKPMAESILQRLEEIASVQDDESLSRKSRIGAFRHHEGMIAEIKQDLVRMEKLLSFTGGVPVPEMMQESALKSDAPSTTTTWMVIFLILIFVGMLAGLFFFTWHRRAQVAQDLAVVRKAAFPGSESAGVGSPTEGGNGESAGPRH